jgi:hypothetical protein
MTGRPVEAIKVAVVYHSDRGHIAKLWNRP